MRPHCLDLAVITVLPDSSVITGTEDLDGVMARSCVLAIRDAIDTSWARRHYSFFPTPMTGSTEAHW